MKNYAHIIDGKVKGVVVFEDESTFEPEEGIFLDVTDVVPQPGPGWTYKTKKFSPPVEQIVELVESPREKALKVVEGINMGTLVGSTTGKALKAIMLDIGLIE